MPIKPNDAKRLWGRSGARCALCKLDLSPVGEGVLLGEMAHIVAQSEDGPRGHHPLPLAERDQYENLILVCRNDHERIDSHETAWSVDRLQAEKLRHERWVQELLDTGAARPVEIDSSQFRDERTAQWAAEQGSWMYVALTPLKITEDAIDPLANSLRLSLEESQLPRFFHSQFSAFPNRVEPSAHGLVAENFSQVNEGMGYRIEVFRNGHIEYAVCLSALLDWYTRDASSAQTLTRGDWTDNSRKVSCTKVLGYAVWAETLIAQLGLLRALWEELPFNDMILTTTLVHTQGVCLLLGSSPFYLVGGRAAEKPELTYSAVMPKTSTREELAAAMLRRLVNYFGFHLTDVFDQQGELQQPTRLGPPRRG